MAMMLPRDTVVRAVALTNYATALATLGRYVESEPRFREAIALLEAARGPDHPTVAAALQPLAGALLFQGKFAEAEQVAERSWQLSRRALGADNPQSVTSQRMLMNVLADAGKCVAALAHARQIIALRHSLPAADASLGTALLYGGWCRAQLGDLEQGTRDAREGLALRLRHFPATHWAVANAQSTLGDILARRGSPHAAEARLLLRAGYEGMRRELDSTHARVVQARERLERFERQER